MQEIIIQKSSDLIQIIYSNGAITIQAWLFFTAVALFLAAVIALYVLMGIGIKKMADNKEIKSNLAFVPFARFYLMGKIVGKCNLFGKPVKNIGVITLIVYTIFCVFGFIYNFLTYFPIVFSVIYGKTIVLSALETGGFQVAGSVVSYADWVGVVMQASYYIQYFIDIVKFFFMLMLFSELFKKYAPEHYFLYAILSSLLNLGGIFVFVVRKRKAVNYIDYVKERYIKMTGGFMNPNVKTTEDPFKEYARKGEYDPGDPFEEFATKPKEDTEKKNDSDNTNNSDNNEN